MHPLHRPFALLALTLAFLGVATAAPLPTQAWRRIFNTGTNDDQGGAGDVDASGNYYMHYVSASSSQWTSHFVKIGPTSGIYFDKTVSYTSNFRSLGTPHELADVLRVAHCDLRECGSFIRAELQDQIARIAHLLQAAHQLHLLWGDAFGNLGRARLVVARATRTVLLRRCRSE